MIINDIHVTIINNCILNDNDSCLRRNRAHFRENHQNLQGSQCFMPAIISSTTVDCKQLCFLWRQTKLESDKPLTLLEFLVIDVLLQWMGPPDWGGPRKR